MRGRLRAASGPAEAITPSSTAQQPVPTADGQGAPAQSGGADPGPAAGQASGATVSGQEAGGMGSDETAGTAEATAIQRAVAATAPGSRTVQAAGLPGSGSIMSHESGLQWAMVWLGVGLVGVAGAAGVAYLRLRKF